jgi:hypothetical protein
VAELPNIRELLGEFINTAAALGRDAGLDPADVVGEAVLELAKQVMHAAGTPPNVQLQIRLAECFPAAMAKGIDRLRVELASPDSARTSTPPPIADPPMDPQIDTGRFVLSVFVAHASGELGSDDKLARARAIALFKFGLGDAAAHVIDLFEEIPS